MLNLARYILMWSFRGNDYEENTMKGGWHKPKVNFSNPSVDIKNWKFWFQFGKPLIPTRSPETRKKFLMIPSLAASIQRKKMKKMKSKCKINKIEKQKLNPASIYLLKVNNKNTRTSCEICSKLTIKTPERRQRCRSWCWSCWIQAVKTWHIVVWLIS